MAQIKEYRFLGVASSRHNRRLLLKYNQESFQSVKSSGEFSNIQRFLGNIANITKISEQELKIFLKNSTQIKDEEYDICSNYHPHIAEDCPLFLQWDLHRDT